MFALLVSTALAHPPLRETRVSTLPSAARLTVDDDNGGIQVIGWDRPDVKISALVEVNADSPAEAQLVASKVAITTAGGHVSATGPENTRTASWSVSYEISAPRATDLVLTTTNGGLAVEGVSADVGLTTTNGGIALANVGGNVHGKSTNGGLTVTLSGAGWSGAGLDLSTTNGGITVEAPRGYAADFHVSTVHGGVSGSRPSVAGGPPVHLETVNGAISIAEP